jgi:hypothetical protein
MKEGSGDGKKLISDWRRRDYNESVAIAHERREWGWQKVDQ